MKKNQGRKKSGTRNKSKFVKGSVEYLLESGTIADMRSAKQVTAELLKHQWNCYAELACQRNTIQDQAQQKKNKWHLKPLVILKRLDESIALNTYLDENDIRRGSLGKKNPGFCN